MNILIIEAKEIKDLTVWSKRPEALDTEFHDCPMCQKRQGHYREPRWHFLPVFTATSAVTLLTVFSPGAASLGDGVITFITAYLTSLLGAAYLVAHLEIRARRKAHSTILNSLRPAARALHAMAALMTDIHARTVGPRGSLSQILLHMADPFLQRAMNAQYELLQSGGDKELRSALLSAIGRARRIRQHLTEYTETATRILDVRLSEARELSTEASCIGPVGMNDSLGEMSAFAAECELLAIATAAYAPSKAWCDEVQKVFNDHNARYDFDVALGKEFDHGTALAILEDKISKLPPLPAS